jgi:hypothetical protein
LLEHPKALGATTWLVTASVKAKNSKDSTMGNQQRSVFGNKDERSTTIESS